MNIIKIKIFITVIASLLALSSQVSAQSPLKLKLAHFLPTGNGLHSDFMEPWARELESCSSGTVEVEIFPGGTQLGNPTKLYDAVRSGAVDIANGLSGMPGGRFERSRIAELPFVFKNADEASRSLWKLFPDYLQDEYPGVKMLALYSSNPGQVHTTKKSVTNINDMSGLRLRFPTAATASMIKALGGDPVGLPPGNVYENAEKGVIDGAVFTWDTMDSFNLAEVMKYHLDAKTYVATFWFGINQASYDKMPENVKACIDQSTGDVLVAKFGNWWNKWDKAGYDLANSAGHEITVLSDEQRANWLEKLQPMIDNYLANLENKGISNAREIYTKMKEISNAN
ncbi:C4-dicarboxylate ABC transporter [Marinomonas ushuaiensis DSM 15871]|uniref:C4-dicarboxylate ABC transporter n=1 Tax=Marinomonas ushuaiensis DSM 15871 TaxID=1122207 RepID=X7E7R9_9GAMM|nr:TRAP transporter substrate-binding protein [Marinomonas ushuaiensis]ETX12124.1 C4-dicarboxylate ABC transporter [Marinomonas ushuaiensis DSM 15871]